MTKAAVDKFNADTNTALDEHAENLAQTKYAHQQEVSSLEGKFKDDTMEGLISHAKKIQEINQEYNGKLSDIDAKHGARVTKVNQANAEAMQQAQQRTQLEGEAKEIQQHLGDHLINAEAEARAEAKSKYPEISTTRDAASVGQIAKNALSELKGSDNPPPVLKRIMDENTPDMGAGGFGKSTGPTLMGRHLDLSNATDMAAYQRFKASGAFTPEEIKRMEGPGSEPLTADEIHGYMSEVGRELGKEGLPGDVRASLSNAYAGFATTLRSMYKEAGKEPEFLDAQKTWKKYQDTFYDPKALSKGGSPIAKAFHAVDPEYVKETGPYASRYLTGDLADKAEKQLGEYSHLGAKPELIRSLRTKLEQIEALPKTLKLRDVPEHPGYPAKPKIPDANLPSPPKGPESVAYKSPKLPEPVDPQGLKREAVQKLATTLRGTGGLRLSLDLLSIMRAIKSGDPSLLMYPIGRRIAGRALESPGAMDWLTKPTPEELKSLPKVPTMKVAAKRAQQGAP
jgi:hypothetical protein